MNHLLNSISLGDCFDAFEFIPDKSVDLVLCDLPYGVTACHWDVVQDNTSGSGTTAIAALNTGRQYICVEKDMANYLQSVKRVNEHKELVCQPS